MLAQWFADIPGADCYVGGLMLRPDSYSQAQVEQLFSSLTPDWLLVVEGYPSLIIPNDQAAAIKITLFDRKRSPVMSSTHTIGGHPSIVHPRIAKTALAMVREYLIQSKPDRDDRLYQETSS